MSKPIQILKLEEILGEKIDELEELHDRTFKQIGRFEHIGYWADYDNKILKLNLEYCKLVDISFLTSFTHLKFLRLEGNSIRDITPLQNLKLISLDLKKNDITDISPLKNLDTLLSLDLSYNSIVDIAPLTYLNSISELYLNNNFIVDIFPLKNLTSLINLKLWENPISDSKSIESLIGIDIIEKLQLQMEIEKQTNPIENKYYYLFIDTETTGLPSNWNAPVSDLDNWPRLVQIGWKIFDKNRNLIENEEFIIEPDGFEIPEEASKVHGIYQESALQEGVPLQELIDYFINIVAKCRYVIAHNMSFDENIIGAECIRVGKDNVLEKCTKICTMLSSIEFCNIRLGKEYKYPKLSELYLKLFNKKFEEKHNALYDVQATADCFWKMLDLNIVSLLDVNNKTKNNNMSIRTKTEWLKGFLEAIELNENISKKQIQMLKEKLDDLLNTVEGKGQTSNYSKPSSEVADDLPF